MKFIFDLDGTLYKFKDSDTFDGSSLSRAIKKNIYNYFIESLNIHPDQTPAKYQELKKKYNGHMSLAIENEYGIDRKIYFNHTWNLNPENFIEKNQSPRNILLPLANQFAILTEAPMIWARAVLEYLDILDLTDDKIFTGDLLIRKPSSEAFQNIKNILDDGTDSVYAVGDQEETDILPAKKIGLKTIKIGHGQTSADFQINSIYDLPNIIK